MATVNIIIKGISMSYHKGDGIWKVLFPFGECHEIKFKEDGETDISLAGANRQIRITTENANSTFEIGETYNDFLDLTAEYSHIDGVRLKEGWDENAALMTIENAELSVNEYTETEHLMLKDSSVTLAPTQIGYSGKAVIESERVIIDIDDHPDFPKIFDTDCTLIFDNDCDHGATRVTSDFDMVYNVVEDINSSNERFVVTKLPEEVDFPIFVGKVFDKPGDGKYRDPFARGLPCHKVRISITEDLI